MLIYFDNNHLGSCQHKLYSQGNRPGMSGIVHHLCIISNDLHIVNIFEFLRNRSNDMGMLFGKCDLAMIKNNWVNKIDSIYH